VLSQGSSEPAWYRINRLLLIHLGLYFNSNQILKDYELPYVDGAQYIYLLFISYERRTVGKTADVRIVFSQHIHLPGTPHRLFYASLLVNGKTCVDFRTKTYAYVCLYRWFQRVLEADKRVCVGGSKKGLDGAAYWPSPDDYSYEAVKPR
jgi:hypothetical protein